MHRRGFVIRISADVREFQWRDSFLSWLFKSPTVQASFVRSLMVGEQFLIKVGRKAGVMKPLVFTLNSSFVIGLMLQFHSPLSSNINIVSDDPIWWLRLGFKLGKLKARVGTENRWIAPSSLSISPHRAWHWMSCRKILISRLFALTNRSLNFRLFNLLIILFFFEKQLNFVSFVSSRFSKRYELPLLIQSVVMNITMFLMIHLCVKVRRNNNIMRARERVFSGKKLSFDFLCFSMLLGGVCKLRNVEFF